MIKGFYASVSAMVADMDRQRTLAHNIANIETAGFKQILTSLTDFEETRVTFSPGNITHTTWLHRIGEIGLGTKKAEEFTDYSEGGMKYTGNMYDFAIGGAGFFTIDTPDGVMYTRDGRFIRDADDQLVTVDGYRVLNTDGQSITIPENARNVSVDTFGTISFIEETEEADGSITLNTRNISQLNITAFEDPVQDLERGSGNSFTAVNDPSDEVSKGDLQQRYLEMSNIDVSQLMTQMVILARSYEASQKMVITQDGLLSQTIAKLAF